MTHHKDEARRIAPHSRAVAGLLAGVASLVVGACNDQDHPPLVPSCGPLDGAVAYTDAGPDAGTAVVSCGASSNVPGVRAVPPGGPPPNNPVISIGGAPATGAGGSAGTGPGGSSFGGAANFGAGGFFNGIGGTGFAGGATGQSGMGTGVGAFAGLPLGMPGIGGLPF